MNTLLPNEILRGDTQISPIRHHYDKVTFGVLRLLWRQKLFLAALVAATVLTTLIVVSLLEPRYTADVTLQLDVRRSEASFSTEPVPNINVEPAAIVAGETKILQSRSMARRVVERLNLTSDPAYQPDPSEASRALAWMAGFLNWTAAGKPQGEPPPIGTLEPGQKITTPGAADLIARRLLENLKVWNDGQSYLLFLSFTSSTPEKSALIANAFAQEYLQSRIEARVDAAQGTSAWLLSQIESARADLETAEREIQDFRGRSGTVETGTDGASVLQQRLRDATTQLGTASAARLSAEMRHRQAADLVAAGNAAAVLDLAGSPLIQRLLESEAAAKRELAELSTKYGARHPEILRASSGLQDIQARLSTAATSALAELAGKAAAARLEEEALVARVETLQKTLIEAKGNETRLKNLQTHADGIRDRLRILTTNFERAKAMADFNTVTAQIVVPAEALPIPSGPNAKLALGLAVIGSLGCGIAAVLVAEKRDSGFRSSAEVRSEMDVRPLGMLPELPADTIRSLDPFAAKPEKATVLFWEAVRSISAAAGLAGTLKAPRLVLITSSVPAEGKSVLACALAGSLAATDTRVLVIDGGLERHQWIADRSVENLDDIVANEDSALCFFEASRERSLSIVGRSSGPDTGWGTIASPSFETFLREARKHFDVILIECPAVMLAADSLVLGRAADTVIHAARWHDTKKRTVEMAIWRLRDLSIRVSGVALTRVDLRKHRKYSTLDECYFYSRHRDVYERYL